MGGSVIFMHNFDYAIRNKLNEYVISFITSIGIWTITYPLDTIFHRYLIGINNYYNLYRGIQYPLIRSAFNTISGLFVYNKINSYLKDIK